MPTKPVRTFTSWSYSRLQDWEKCPLFARLKHMDKVKEPGNKAMDRGNVIHKEAEDFAIGVTKTRPESLNNFVEEFDELRRHKKKLVVEADWALTKTWVQTTWFDSDALPGQLPWVRVRVDTALPEPVKKTIRMIDYKTGKVRDSHIDQLELYALVAFAIMPKINTCNSELWYLDEGRLEEKKFVRKQEAALREKWLKRVTPMLADGRFQPKPGALCSWCWYGQSGKRKGGPGLCKY